MMSFNSNILYFSCLFSLDDTSIGKSEILKLPTITDLNLIWGFLLSSIYRTKQSVFSAYIFIIIIASWQIIALTSVKWISLSLLINCSWKSIWSDIRIAMISCFLSVFSQPSFPTCPKVLSIFDGQMVSCRQQKDILLFLCNQPVNAFFLGN